MKYPVTALAFLSFLLPLAAQEKAPENAHLDKPAVMRGGSVEIDGRQINYHATTGTLTLKKPDGAPRASIFHITYTRDAVGDLSTRPVLFAFNGGPGASAVWLHLGLLGPKHLALPGDGTTAPEPPARLADNPFSILDAADLVLVDPVSTGYSRVEKEGKPEEFHGLRGDIESLSDFIRRWITEHKRWQSPKYLLGESYGGVRVAGLAEHLQSRYGMPLNGIVLMSTLLDFRTLSPSPGNDLAYSCLLPNYTAIALHHGKLQGDRDQLVAQAREFAWGEYHAALVAGTSLPRARQEQIAHRLSELTSLSPQAILAARLRVDPWNFRAELLRKEGQVIGRFDARVAWPATDPAARGAGYDPSFSLALGSFTTAMLSYLSEDLGWEEDSPYEVLTGKVQPWNWNSSNSYVNMSDSLVTAMRDNPHLRVLVMAGDTDLATTGDGMRYSLNHLLDLPQERRANIGFEEYQAGHMFYLNPPDLAKCRKDLLRFLRQN